MGPGVTAVPVPYKNAVRIKVVEMNIERSEDGNA
jgi:hypothetical protein